MKPEYKILAEDCSKLFGGLDILAIDGTLKKKI
jgi:hypothetical protein